MAESSAALSTSSSEHPGLPYLQFRPCVILMPGTIHLATDLNIYFSFFAVDESPSTQSRDHISLSEIPDGKQQLVQSLGPQTDVLPDVLPDGAIEQDCVLWNDSHMCAERPLRDHLQVLPIYLHAARRWVKIPENDTQGLSVSIWSLRASQRSYMAHLGPQHPSVESDLSL